MSTLPTPLHTLIVEDRAADAKLIVRELERAGFDPKWKRVETEEDFVSRLEPSLDVILADYTMPSFGAARALELLQKCSLDIPFIIISGTIGEDIAVAAMKQGAADYLSKDRLSRLGPAVNRVLEQSRLRKQHQGGAGFITPANVSLRSSAEQRLRAVPPAGKSPSVRNLRSAIAELHIYEAELEIQNEELLDDRAQIEESQKKYFRHFDLAPVGLIRLNRQGLILETNILGAQMLDVDRALLYSVPRPFLAHVAPDSLAVFEQHLESALSSGRMEMCELLLRGATGHETFVRMQSVISRSEKDETDFYITLTDLTERREIEQKLELHLLRAQRLESIGTLASGVAHDLNNTLVPILMAAPILRDELPKQERLKFLDIVESSAQRSAQIVRQVLSFARGADGDHLLLQPVYVLAEIAKIIEETFSKTISVRTSYPEALWLIEGDPTQLHQVILNLCVNARDSMPEGGNLSLTAENFDVDENYATMTPGLKPGPHVLLNVIDTGSGIPSHIIDKIFDPFFTTKELGKGTGLGLSTALGIVKSHGGVLNVCSSANGTTFRVLLPAAPGARPPAELEAQTEIPTGHGETILLIDDEAAIREVAKAVLSQSGYNVLTAEDGPSALAIFPQQSKEIAVVLTDSEMPIMSGLMLARIVRKMDSETKIILSTARDTDFSEAELSNVGVQACLNKPYTRETLLRTVDRVLHNILKQ